MRSIRPFLLFFPLLCSYPAFASPGTEGASFLDIPVGAGPAALGGSYSTRASNAYGIVWNPAGLGRINGWEVAGQHLDYLESIHYEFAGLAIPLRPGSTLGLGVQYLGAGDIQGTDNSGLFTHEFSSHYAAYSLGYGQVIGEKLSLGLTAKAIEAELSDVHARAFGGDLGALYQANERWAFAGTLTNLGSSLRFIDQPDPLPMAFTAGILYAPTSHWNFSVDGKYQRTSLTSAHTGIQWRPLSSVSLRAGYRTDTLKDLSPLAGFSTGIGVEWWGQEFAYAWVPLGELGNTQYLSLLLKFGKDAENRRRNLVYLGDIHKHRPYRLPATLRDPQEGSDALTPAEIESMELIHLLTTHEPDVALHR